MFLIPDKNNINIWCIYIQGKDIFSEDTCGIMFFHNIISLLQGFKILNIYNTLPEFVLTTKILRTIITGKILIEITGSEKIYCNELTRPL